MCPYIVSVLVWMQMISSDQRAEFSCVDDELEWSEDRSLWNTVVLRFIFRLTAIISNALYTVCLVDVGYCGVGVILHVARKALRRPITASTALLSAWLHSSLVRACDQREGEGGGEVDALSWWSYIKLLFVRLPPLRATHAFDDGPPYF